MQNKSMWLFSLLIAHATHAEMFSYPPQKIRSAGITSIKVSGVNGRIHFAESSGKNFVVKVKHSRGQKFEDWNLLVERQGKQLVLEVFNVAFGHQWRTQVRQELYPEFDIEIRGPAKPVVVGWRDGEISVEGWKSDVEASLLNGKVRTRATLGALKLQVGVADVAVREHKGLLEVKGEKGRLELAKLDGEVRANWLDGFVHAEDLVGQSHIDLPSGLARVEKLRGRLRGKGVSSEWDVRASAPLDLEVLNDSGPVRVKWIDGGAKLFLSTSTGEIRVSKPLRVEMREGLKVVEGMREKSPRGMVFVRTQSGRIEWQ